MGGYEFANPLLLYGAALASVPVVIHLFNRKRAKPHLFAAIDFVLRSKRRTARRMRLRRLLLFAARTLFLVALPLALARPQKKSAAEALVAQTGPTAVAIVLDTSLSMGYALDGTSLLERAKRMAKDSLAGLSMEDPVALVFCGEDAPAPMAPGFDRAKSREGLEAAVQSHEPQDLTACLGRAAQALSESSLPGKRIVLASDLTAAAFRLDVPSPSVRTPSGEVKPEVVLLDAAGGKQELPNVAVTALRVEPAAAIGHRAFQFTLTVKNHSGTPAKDLTAILKVGSDVVAKGFIDVPAHGAAIKALTYRFPSGGVFTGAVEVSHDSLSADDARHFALRVPRDVKALVVNGAPHAVRFMDEAFFVETALGAPGSPVRPTLRDAETATRERFKDYDVVLLLNVRTLPPEKVKELSALVQDGGGLFLSLGDQIDPDRYNEDFAEILPRKLHLLKTAADRREEGDRKAARLAQVQFEHPALSVFTGEAREGMLSSRFFRYFLLAPGDASQVAQLATFDDGAPAVLEGRKGKGRVILYTSSVDRDWTDWPIRASFLPVMQRMSGFLAGALEERELEQLLVGEPKSLDVPSGVEAIQVSGPAGKEVPVKASLDGRPQILATDAPGLYSATGRISGARAKLPELSFAVNVDPRESDLSRLDERELKAYFGEKTRTEKGSGKDEEGPPALPAWSFLLAAAAALFFLEGLLVRT